MQDDRILLDLGSLRPAEHLGVNFYTGSLDMWGDGECVGFGRQFIVKRKHLYIVLPSRVCDCCGTVLGTRNRMVTDYSEMVVCHARLPSRMVATYELTFEYGKLTGWKWEEEVVKNKLRWEMDE